MPAGAAPPNGINVSGNRLTNDAGSGVRLVGVNRSGSEYACQQGWGPFNGPIDQASIDAMKSWKINMVRLPLNEHCWLGISWAPNTTGTNYRNAITSYVNRLNDNGLYVILDLHFTGAHGAPAIQDAVAPNRQYSVPFWRSVASTFKANQNVLFELYNEPRDIDWNCWRNGCFTWQNFQSAGMQELVNAVRGQGATNPIILNGLDWGHDMRGFLGARPTDSAGQLVAGQHLYNFKRCVNRACWDAEFLPVANAMPLLAPEIGENDCASWFVTDFMRWADSKGGDGYGVWSWGPGECPPGYAFGGSALNHDWSGSTTGFGAGVKAHFLSTSTGGGSTPPPTTTPPSGNCTSAQYTSQYWNNTTLSGTPVHTRCNNLVNNDWGTGSPGPGVKSDGFSARYTRSVTLAGGNYRFSITGDDGIRLFLDNRLILDGWRNQSATTYTTTVPVEAGSHAIKVEYYENAGRAVAKMAWTPV